MIPPPVLMKDLIEEIGTQDDFMKFGCVWKVAIGHLYVTRGMTCTSIPLSKIDDEEFDWNFIKGLP